ncbi:hypothetical protein CRUP_006687 [Coryphaenoides rupestris]|nr:hypothetical protein CRUP_006687 [Coryphaenoides rupestris]
MPMTTPSWCSVPKAPRSSVGEISPTYMGVRPVQRPQNTPMTKRPAITISKERLRLEKPISRPPTMARMLASSIDFRLATERRGKEPIMPPTLKMATAKLHTMVLESGLKGSP